MTAPGADIGLYFATSASIPAEHVPEDAVILLDTGLPSQPEGDEIPAEALRFATTVLVRSARPEIVREEVQRWWAEHAKAELTFELLATDSRQLAENMRASLRGLAEGEWSWRAQFLAFRATSEAALQEARAYLRDNALALDRRRA